jgi:hypothetical protein
MLMISIDVILAADDFMLHLEADEFTSNYR